MPRWIESALELLDRAEAYVRGSLAGFRQARPDTPYDPGAESEYTEEALKALEDWHAAENYFNSINDPDLVEYALYELEAARRKYEFLMRKLRNADAAWERRMRPASAARRLE